MLLYLIVGLVALICAIFVLLYVSFVGLRPGSKGLTGVQGPQGKADPNGTPGAQGVQGAQGVVGMQGPQGVAGPQGDASTYTNTDYFVTAGYDLSNPQGNILQFYQGGVSFEMSTGPSSGSVSMGQSVTGARYLLHNDTDNDVTINTSGTYLFPSSNHKQKKNSYNSYNISSSSTKYYMAQLS